jgi:predicted nuclease of predicted toxin-antitoxin system
VSPLAEPSWSLLFDENLAARLVGQLADAYPGSVHVGDARLLGAADLAVWEYAREHGFVIVSKDEDFHRFSILHGPPPKVIWIRSGNCSTEDVIRLLRLRRREVDSFVDDTEAGFLALA